MIPDTKTKIISDLSYKKHSLNQIISKINELNFDRVNFIYLGQQDYKPIWKLQQFIHKKVKDEDIPGIVLYLEHEHIYTLGKNANKDFLLDSYPKDVDVIQTDRGGQITYHGPGQLVGYPIINLNHFKKSISWYMRSIENVIIHTLQEYDILTERKDGMTGVWVEDEKICAMGVRLSRWITMHGFALNVQPEMKYYDSMIPCGIQEYGITSMYHHLNKEVDIDELIDKISINFLNIFNNIE